MVPYPTTLGDEITFLFCFLPAPQKGKLGRVLKALKKMGDKIKTLV